MYVVYNNTKINGCFVCMLDFIIGIFGLIVDGFIFVFDQEHRKNVLIVLAAFSGCVFLFVILHYVASFFAK
jgi:uncharacterized membrane protein YeaQ/YmgE (transglycosylase-associated protein family)